jgi:hypothetical protein
LTTIIWMGSMLSLVALVAQYTMKDFQRDDDESTEKYQDPAEVDRHPASEFHQRLPSFPGFPG